MSSIKRFLTLGGNTIDELVTKSGLDAKTIRKDLEDLVESGVATKTRSESHGRRGRPPNIYAKKPEK